MPNQIIAAGDNILHSLIQGFTAFMIYVPTLVGALIVLLVGWWISSAIGNLLERGLTRIGFNRAAVRVGASEPLARIGEGWTASHVLCVLAKWFVRLIFLQAAANILAMPQITAIVNEIILFIPRLAVGLLILMFGLWAAKVASELVLGSASAAGVEKPGIFALLTRYAILIVAVLAAASQIGIAPVIVNTLFTAFVGAAALAFGLGGKDVAADMTRSWYSSGKSAVQRLQSVGSRRNDTLPPTGTSGGPRR